MNQRQFSRLSYRADYIYVKGIYLVLEDLWRNKGVGGVSRKYFIHEWGINT